MKEQHRDRLQKQKRGILGIVFSRKALLIVLVLLQILGLYVLFSLLAVYVPVVYGLFLVLEIFLITYIINRGNDQSFQISWLVIIMALPVVGGLFYLFVESQLGARKVRARLRENIHATRPWLHQEPEALEALRKEDPESEGIVRYMGEYGGFPVYQGTDVTYFPSGESQFEELLRQLESAEHFIFMEYFIVEEGEMWNRTLEILRRKVREGVEVRFMYDGTCTLSLLPLRYPKQMEAYGIRCRVFAPVRPVFTTVQNNRDHRKVLVIDGKTAFTGGVNMADEYINRKVRFGHWKDAGIMVKGEAVTSFTMMFLQMWSLSGIAEEKPENYILPRKLLQRPAAGFVMPYGDSPVDDERVGEMVYLDLINRARRYVHIYTPYLVLDQEMITALKFAAKRGVDVRIITPHIPDKRYVYRLAWVFYGELIPAGVRIAEYLPGFIHSKCFVADGRAATVGTVNLDFRSLYLHFECGVYFSMHPQVEALEKDFQRTLEESREITEEDLRGYPWYKRILGYGMRVLAPQL